MDVGVAEAVGTEPEGAAEVTPGLAERAATAGSALREAVAPASTTSDPVGFGMGALPLPEDSPGESDSVAGAVSPDVGDVPPCRPCGAFDDPEKESPAITAARDITPTAPAVTAARRARRSAARLREPRPAARRRSARPPPDGPSPVITGSSRVSSYAFCQPWAAAGSAYSSYAGAASADGTYTFGGGRGSLSGCGWAGLDMARDSRYWWASWDSYRR
ncbi:hypothetical protein [Streptomyces sp. NPDC051636]|uniref:hypothetical protein n=1 Tax=Streptomyces sp. NPDC051636 TaxID=3365663 RepID=UPI00379B0A3C